MPLSRKRFVSLCSGLSTPTEQLSENWSAHAVLVCVIIMLSWHFLFLDIEDIIGSGIFSWVHLIFLPFHEAGHLFFGIFSEFIGSLGGTLGQMLMPLVCSFAFLRSRNDTFGAAVCFWWFSLNFLDIAPYVADARDGVLPLLGGNYGHSAPYGFHDWHYLLTETGMLQFDDAIASFFMWSGRALMVLACFWMVRLLKNGRNQSA